MRKSTSDLDVGLSRLRHARSGSEITVGMGAGRIVEA